jgi:asparagine synthase (glutamine-hydrolysing)
MCGIFGMTARLGDEALDRVSSLMAHRGPDSEGRFVDNAVTLLHRRLKIIDLSPAASQPMTNEEGTLQVIFNGEIYNHRALRAELEAAGHTFRSRSDTEAIVHGYEEWGDAVIERIDGMFALAVWDDPRRRLLAARDRVGKKPLYYSTDGGVLRFASTIAALHGAGLPRAVSTAALPYFLSYGFVPPPATHFDGVLQLPPASRLVWERGQITIDEYWRPHFGVPAGGVPPYAEALRRVRELVTDAVERRLESDVPLGAFLSGGIDSTIIVGLMAKLMRSPVRTFSIGFSGDPKYDETRYAQIAATAFGTAHTRFDVEPSAMELVERLVWHHDGPFGDSSAIPTYNVSQLTRQHVTVALTGDGGDELFCGYQRFLAAEAAEWIPRPLRVLAASAAGVLPPSSSERSLFARGQRFLAAASLPLAERLARWNSFFPQPMQLLRPELAADLDAPLAWQRQMLDATQGSTVLARVLEHNFRTYLPFDLLVKADHTSMANSLELRAPFLDTALIEYAAALPAGYLRRGLTTKRILKDAFADLLPPEIMRRGKMGFGVPLGRWFRGSLKGYLNDLLGRGARLEAYLDAGAVARLLADHDAGRSDHGQRLWLLLTFEVWLRSLATDALACAA